MDELIAVLQRMTDDQVQRELEALRARLAAAKQRGDQYSVAAIEEKIAYLEAKRLAEQEASDIHDVLDAKMPDRAAGPQEAGRDRLRLFLPGGPL